MSSSGPSRPASAGHGSTVYVDDPAWRAAVRGAEAIARRAAAAAGGGAVVLASDAVVKRLNHRHRGRNKPTNVLTFDAGGEIILALGTVRREAHAAGRRAAHHLAHLVVHGALHLRGHDHHLPGDASRMERAEARILHRLGVPNPWRLLPSLEATGFTQRRRTLSSPLPLWEGTGEGFGGQHKGGKKKERLRARGLNAVGHKGRGEFP